MLEPRPSFCPPDSTLSPPGLATTFGQKVQKLFLETDPPTAHLLVRHVLQKVKTNFAQKVCSLCSLSSTFSTPERAPFEVVTIKPLCLGSQFAYF